MRKRGVIVLLLVICAIVAATATGGSTCPGIKNLQIESPTLVRELTPEATHKSKPIRVAWSGDDSEIYLTGYRIGKKSKIETYHFVLKADGSGSEEVESAPYWAQEYLDWKQSLSAPGGTAKLTTRSGSITAASGRDVSHFQGNIPVIKVSIGGTRIRELKGEQLQEGLWYAWAPEGGNALVYVNDKGNLCAVDYAGEGDKVLQKGKFTLPAWSNKADRVAYVEPKKGGKCWRVYTAAVK